MDGVDGDYASFAETAEGADDYGSAGGEGDGSVERNWWLVVFCTDPFCSEGLGLLAVVFASGGDVDFAFPVAEDFDGLAGGGSEAEEADALAGLCACYAKAAEADDSGAEERGYVGVVEGVGERVDEVGADEGVLGVASVDGVAGEDGIVAEVFFVADAEGTGAVGATDPGDAYACAERRWGSDRKVGGSAGEGFDGNASALGGKVYVANGVAMYVAEDWSGVGMIFEEGLDAWVGGDGISLGGVCLALVDDFADDLVSEDEGLVDEGEIALVDVEVGAADSAGQDAEEHVVGGEGGDRKVFDLEGLVGGVQDGCFHELPPGAELHEDTLCRGLIMLVRCRRRRICAGPEEGMMQRRFSMVVAAGLLMAAPMLAKSKDKTLPPYILAARTVAVIIDPGAGMDPEDPQSNRVAQKDVETALMNWGRLQPIVGTTGADLIIVIRKGHARLADATIGDPRQNDRIGSITPMDNGVGIGAQNGSQPNIGGPQRGAAPPANQSQSQAQAQTQAASPQLEIGGNEDSFTVFDGKVEKPLDSPPGWRYMARDGLRSHNVPAVDEFKRAVAAAEKAAAAKNP
jgi:hypothetical protein